VTYILYTLFFISCIVLIATVLLQPGKTDAGALFTSNISSSAFQPRGSQTILSKMTIVAATTFMLTALLLAMPALTGNLSVLETNAANATETTPATNVNTNANVTADSNANVVPANTATVVNNNQLPDSNAANVNK
jgi:protein translocase SecG subunit